MPYKHWTLHVEPGAPAKPAYGTPCNGCGICCLAEPCPLGMVLSGKRRGACRALRWDSLANAYACGAMTDTPAVLARLLPAVLQFAVPLFAPALRRLAPRWIAAGKGCDSTLEPAAPTMADAASTG